MYLISDLYTIYFLALIPTFKMIPQRIHSFLEFQYIFPTLTSYINAYLTPYISANITYTETILVLHF